LINPASNCLYSSSAPARGDNPGHSGARRARRRTVVSVEFCAEFHARLTLDLPEVNLSMAMHLIWTTLGDLSACLFDCVISGIPLLNFPVSAGWR
jgi:phosphatidylethanolamine/phosphatidyl-N-methylethanolamine N-methyltransferase